MRCSRSLSEGTGTDLGTLDNGNDGIRKRIIASLAINVFIGPIPNENCVMLRFNGD
jgi:hypothetical protein